MKEKINHRIDHTFLKQDLTEDDVKRVCSEALQHNFAAVCIPPSFVSLTKELLTSKVKTCTVAGFPLGYSTLETKIQEIAHLISSGADEIDVVLNISFVKNNNWHKVENELKLFSQNKLHSCLKVIIESGILTDDEITKVCTIANQYNIDYMKTSTGFAKTGATKKAVQIMRSSLRPEIKIKASGGIKTYADALEYISIGADRLGCSSSVEIIS